MGMDITVFHFCKEWVLTAGLMLSELVVWFTDVQIYTQVKPWHFSLLVTPREECLLLPFVPKRQGKA